MKAFNLVIIGPNALSQADSLARQAGMHGRGMAVCEDAVMAAALEGRYVWPTVFRTVPFDNEQLYCCDRSLTYLRMQLGGEADYLLAIGGEIIQSLVKLAAKELHVPYIAVPTGAYGLSLATRWAQQDTPLGLSASEGVAPAAILMDTTLISRAPEGVTLSGIRALIERMGLLAREKALALAGGFAFDKDSCQEQEMAVDEALKVCNEGLRQGRPEAYEALCQALVVCGRAEDRHPLPHTLPARLTFLNEG